MYGGYEAEYATTYEFLECCGCGDICFRKRDWFSETNETIDEYFPARIARRRPEWCRHLPDEYYPLVDELYSCLDSGNRILALIGTRTVLDTFILRKVGDCGTFAKSLDKLVANNYLASANRPIIESALEAGSAAAHRAYLPTPEILGAVLDIVENIIQLDVLEKSVETIRKAVPPRGAVNATGGAA